MCNLRHYANCNFSKPQYNVPIVSCFLFNEILFTTLRLIITHHIHHLHTQKSAVFSRHSLIFFIFSLKYPHLFKYMHFSKTQGLHCTFLSLKGNDTGLPECFGEFLSFEGLCKQHVSKRTEWNQPTSWSLLPLFITTILLHSHLVPKII